VEVIDAILDHMHSDTITQFALEVMTTGNAHALRCLQAFKSVLVDIEDGSSEYYSL